MIRIDGYENDATGSDWFCYHASSPLIFPPGADATLKYRLQKCKHTSKIPKEAFFIPMPAKNMPILGFLVCHV
jgi:hypothetical protein